MEQQIEQSIENDVSDAEEEVVEMLLVIDVLESRHLVVFFLWSYILGSVRKDHWVIQFSPNSRVQNARWMPEEDYHSPAERNQKCKVGSWSKFLYYRHVCGLSSFTPETVFSSALVSKSPPNGWRSTTSKSNIRNTRGLKICFSLRSSNISTYHNGSIDIHHIRACAEDVAVHHKVTEEETARN